MSLLEECRGRVERALAALGAGASRDARREMKLHAALGASLIYTRGAAVPEIGAAWTRALEIAESLDDAEYQLRALWGLWVFHTASGRHRAALALAQRFHASGGEATRPERSADRRADDRRLAALSRRPAQRAAPSRTRARSLCHSRPNVAHYSLSARPAGDGARLSLRGSCGCRDFRIRRCAQPKAASRTLARPITRSRCVTLWPTRRARSRC